MSISQRKGVISWVHGFLGEPSDFAHLLWPSESWDHDPRDLWLDLGSLASTGLDLSADWLSLSGARLAAGISGRKRPTVLVGYSMGGRLALQAASNPDLWPWLKGLVLVSTHPGLTNEAERQTRLDSDFKWARRFEQDSWPEVIRDWEAQSVLRRSGEQVALRLERQEGRINRRLLALAMVVWSLGRQRPFFGSAEPRSAAQDTGHWPFPVLLITGEEDLKFTALASAWASSAGINHLTIPKAGHRAPWDNPSAFLAAIQDFLTRLSTGE